MFTKQGKFSQLEPMTYNYFYKPKKKFNRIHTFIVKCPMMVWNYDELRVEKRKIKVRFFLQQALYKSSRAGR